MALDIPVHFLDPDELLQEMRDLVARYNAQGHDTVDIDVHAMFKRFEALDAFLSDGTGRTPKAWNPKGGVLGSLSGR